jgi:hypothetical protein
MPTTVEPVVVLTSFHSFSGTVTLHDQRLSDMLNDRRDTVVEVTDAAVARISQASKVIDHHNIAVIRKDHVVMVFEVSDQSMRTAKRPYAYTLKRSYEVFLAMEGLEVRGVMHTTGNFDVLELHRLVAVSGDKFMPVTDASVTLPNLDFRKQGGVLINVHHIHSISKIQDQP